MHKPAERRLHLSDLMLLVAATAPAFLVVQMHWPIDTTIMNSYVNITTTIRNFMYVLSFPMAAWTLTLFLLRLRRPRPPMRQLIHHSGTSACTGAVVVMVVRLITLALVLGFTAVDLPSYRSLPGIVVLIGDIDEFQAVPSEIGCAVAAIWTLQLISGQWEARPSWIDRLGRVLGMFWIGTIPFSWFSFTV
jgi:hypothetical protein